MTLLEQLERYEPFNEQEAADLPLMLRALRTMPDALRRDNGICHFTASNWITNPGRDQILMVHHNIYNHWAWTGGHADGEADLRAVARREAREETGLRELRPLHSGIFSIQVLTVDHHVKRGKYVPSHLHLDCCYLWEADDAAPLRAKADENSGVRWVPIDEVLRTANEPVMDVVYEKLNDKLRSMGKPSP